MSATADQLRNRKILVKVDDELTITCRQPDVLALIASGGLQLPIFAEVLEQVSAIARDEPLAADAQINLRTYYELVDRWVCAAAEAPRFVMTEEEALADPSLMWVQDLPREVRLSIIAKTQRPLASGSLKALVTSFRSHRPDGPRAGSDGETVRDEAVGTLVGA